MRQRLRDDIFASLWTHAMSVQSNFARSHCNLHYNSTQGSGSGSGGYRYSFSLENVCWMSLAFKLLSLCNDRLMMLRKTPYGDWSKVMYL
jgi:hypothetical protein